MSDVAQPSAGEVLERLRGIVAALRDPEGGCPWDLKQDHQTMAHYIIEEGYEVLEAIDAGKDPWLCEELGDLLFQVVFHARLAEERGAFALNDVVSSIADKMVARHPHVFGDLRGTMDADQVRTFWEKSKQQQGRNVLDGVPQGLPALQRAQRLTTKAATVGFDWDVAEKVLLKAEEEIEELREAMASGNRDAMEDELGDVLFVFANLARKLDLQAEQALRRTMHKFETRFHYVEETLLAQGSSPQEASLEEMDALWNAAKRQAASKNG